jgi:hypothetical protein
VQRRFSTNGETLERADRAVEAVTLDEWRDYCEAFAVA